MKSYDYDCPIEAALEVIGGKWKAICVYYLKTGPLRFSELHDLLETVSSRMLSKQLKELQAQGIVRRTVYPEAPPRVEYALTEYGRTLLPLIDLMCAWGEERLAKIGKRAVYN